MAAPHVAGAAALLFAAYPNESASQIKARILSGARNVDTPYYWANGILDVAGAYGLPVITTSSFLGGAVGFSYSKTLNASGTKPIIWSLDSGKLPDGLILNPNTGLSAGTYTATVTVSGAIASRSFNVSLIVVPEPVYSISLYPATDKVYDPVTVGYGAQAPHNVTINNTGNQPTGLLRISLSGPYGYRFKLNKTLVSNVAAGGSGNFTITPNKGLAAGTYATTVVVSGQYVTTQSFNVSFTVSQNPTSAYGISLNPATNKNFGIVTERYAAQAPHSVIVNNAGNQPTGELNISLSGANASSFMLNKTIIPSIALGEIDSFSITPITGLTEGTYTATVTVSGPNVTSRLFNVSFTVSSASGIPIIITPSLPEGNIGMAYSAILTAAGATPITWSIDSGSLPDGLSLSNGGAISGTPTKAGLFNFTVKAMNSAGSDTKQFSIAISALDRDIIMVDPKYSSSINYAAAKTPDISATDLEIVEGRVTIRKSIAEAIAKKLLETNDIEVVLLPWFEATIESGKIAAVRIPIRGSQLYANYPKDILLLKVISSDTGEFLEHVSSEADYSDGKFTLLAKGNETPYSGKINSGTEYVYVLVVFIKDGGKYDLDKAINGNVVDPIAIVRRVQSGGNGDGGGGGGGGGCKAASHLFIMLLVIHLFIKRTD